MRSVQAEAFTLPTHRRCVSLRCTWLWLSLSLRPRSSPSGSLIPCQNGVIYGVTMRVGRFFRGCADVIEDVLFNVRKVNTKKGEALLGTGTAVAAALRLPIQASWNASRGYLVRRLAALPTSVC